MKCTKTSIEGVYMLEPTVWYDERGYFIESYNTNTLSNCGLNFDFVQDNEAKSSRGILRGMHYQKPPYSQTKLVRVIEGEVLDVIVDIRPGSSTFGKHLSIILNSTNKKQLLVPRGMAHGYIVLSDTALFAYKCDNHYNKASEAGIKYNDPTLNIDWILPKHEIIISSKDEELPYFADHDIFI